jgi:murein DD-endopeptidase MepM/ murein hydrolase activator NlpD
MVPTNTIALFVFSLLLTHLSFSATHSNDSTKENSQNIDIEIITEDVDSDRIYYAKNSEYCPVTLKLVYQGHMRKKMGKEYDQILVPARNERTKLVTINNFTCDDRDQMKILYIYGDVLQKQYDKDFVYTLPYAINSEFRASQSSDGGYLQNLDYALDFQMPLQTEVSAARGGTVVMVVNDKIANCRSLMCPDLGNYILIYHEDGSFAVCGHLFKNSAQVKVGEKVNAGQFIAKSGNTGWSTGMQLHFQVFLSRFDSDGKTIQPKFQLSPESEPVHLEHNNSYKRLL